MPHEDELPRERSRFLRRLVAFDLRAQWWRFLDGLDARPRLRRCLAIGAPLALAACLGLALARPWWKERNFARITREWIAMGRLDYAEKEVREAMEHRPDSALTWILAAELARGQGDHETAADRSSRAARLQPDDLDLARLAASDALLAGQPGEARSLLENFPAVRLEEDAECLRLLAELSRQAGDLDSAVARLEAVSRLVGPETRDRATLGRLLLLFPEGPRREEGRRRLGALVSDPEWGAIALRALLVDAMQRDDAASRLRLARLLRAHPLCAAADVPVFLRAVAELAPAELPGEIASLAAAHRATPALALRFVDWMNQIGRPRDALDFAADLPTTGAVPPVLQVALSESLRLAGDWDGLAARTGDGDWGGEYEFLRLAYALEAARRHGDTVRRDQLWATLRARLTLEPVHSAYAAGLLYIWGLPEEALAAAELATSDPGSARTALGLVLRHHQSRRDAEGQYQALRRLAVLRDEDPDIRNNLAYFSALLGKNLANARELAARNLALAPQDPRWRATLAFVETRLGDPRRALQITGSPIDWAGRDHALALPYGLALAALQRADEARPVLAALLAEADTTAEEDLIREALRSTSPPPGDAENPPRKTP